ncbi:peptidoglycan D,D-transpeptidase FtsI family protein [Microbulbifer thermotolerans]|uniref:peptidoglycan D,D-transpeptidase FtsI family protein n=1 Tax=Microbulbifer thermotolerans TaxID=252514 RepID=UPI0008F39118|nr:penicillin-binding transpeptidase domain-containing protein [Microbulbifer thermotolerans]MCX2780754.1 penicillin-binding transpeptidase domain-containing protein [Microbulbifer thermotolerans]MCX2806447.1 penicillin-binding transpeptidase domain-containing protein [Microbulbifer thermotolerans]MCX2830089.1 penicillin-binding transpeptidase domain-containing protein [Microbulbifer thermotolerans]MCX2834287.1 penicillin-binding transpeptidase domain-containing protein [Microbulbifer thermotol
MGAVKKQQNQPGIARWRFALVAALLCLLALALIFHLARLQVLPEAERGYRFLQDQGRARTIRTEEIPAYRGAILDRNGELLAVSTPVHSLWANPQLLREASAKQLRKLAAALDMNPANLAKRLEKYRNKEFMYLRRHLSPEQAGRVLDLQLTGVYSRKEYRRFYPAGEVVAQLVGFTDIDDRGQEGLELAYEDWLSGQPGAQQVVKDLKGRTVQDLATKREARPGRDLRLSIDMRLQYLAYRELKKAVAENDAASGFMVILDTRSGDVLAMANQPSFNPNNRSGVKAAATRNRALIDQFEPGSTVKPLTALAALETGRYQPHTPVDTSPGYIRVPGKTLVDPVNYGRLDLTGVITKSSQVGITKIALDLEPNALRELFYRLGLGEAVGTGFPGEAAGILPSRSRWHPIERANFAFGYGLTVNGLQLAQAYSVLANAGLKRPVSLVLSGEKLAVEPERVVDGELAKQVTAMLETVIGAHGTGKRAAVEGYRVAGKTGTVHKVGTDGYADNRYRSVFAGFIPADNPRLAAVVVIDDPRHAKYYGGEVAAPVFGSVMAGAMRLLRVPPAELAPAAQQLARSLPAGQAPVANERGSKS